MTDDLQPGTLVQWRDPYGGGRRVGTLVRIERHREPKPGKARKPSHAIIETGGAIAPSDRHKVPASMVEPYARRYYPDGTTAPAPPPAPPQQQDDPGDGSPVLTLPI